MGRARRVALAAALLGAVVFAATPAAAEPEPLRVIVRLARPGDADLLDRVLGHVSDLDVALAVERGPLEVGLPAQLARARGLVGPASARVVVWFEPTPGGELLVYVAEPAAGRLLARRIAADGDSPLREAAALVVRSALRVLADGGQIGVVAPAPAPVPPTAPSPSLLPPAGGGRVRWAASLGWAGAADGARAGQQGLSGRLAAARGRLALGLFATAGLPADRRDDRSTVELARHSAGLSVGVASRPSARWHAEVGLAMALLGYARATTEVEPGLMATPGALSLAFAVGPEVRLAWMPRAGRGALGLEATLAVDLVLGAPELVYDLGGEAVVRDRLWPIQPRAGLAIVVRGP